MKQLAPMIVLLASTGCGLMPSRQPDKTDFDFGPLGAQTAGTSKASEGDVVVRDITAPVWMDHSAMYYRLAYRNAATPMPYAQSEWVMSPAALLTQRLRARLEGEGIWAQRTFSVEKPAPSADAAGGVTALTECSDALAAEIGEWVAATRSSTRATESARNGP